MKDAKQNRIRADARAARSDALVMLDEAKRQRDGFLTEQDVRAMVLDPRTRLTPCLVRCGGCRFIVGTQDVAHLIDIIETDGRDYVRDVSVAQAEEYEQVRRALTAIYAVVDGESWSPASRTRIADILTDAGYHVRAPEPS